MTRHDILIFVQRDTGLEVEILELVREGDKACLLFPLSDAASCRVDLDPSKIRPLSHPRIQADFLYRAAVKAPPPLSQHP